MHVLAGQVRLPDGDHPLRPHEAVVRLDGGGGAGQHPGGHPAQVGVPGLGPPHPVLQGVELVLLVEVPFPHAEVLHQVLLHLLPRGQRVGVVLGGVVHVTKLLAGRRNVMDVDAVHEQGLVALPDHVFGVGLRLQPVLGGQELQFFVSGVQHRCQLVVDGDSFNYFLVDRIAKIKVFVIKYL